MTEAAAVIADHDQLIRDVFIDPIRTVIVVDDEYPTLDSLAAKEMGGGDGWKGDKKEVQRVRELLSFARGKNRPWLVDVHDGKKVTSTAEQWIAPYLQHSDLLILDYHLDGDEGKGDKAIEILRKLAKSDHFNLVIVHTKGYEGDINKVIREISLGLTYPDPALCLPDAETQALKEALDNWEEEEDGICSRLRAEISEETYLQARIKCAENYDRFLSLEEGKRILAFLKKCPKDVHIDSKKLAKWLLFEKQGTLAQQFSPENLGFIQLGRAGDVNWIRADKLFITVLSKECSPDQFETMLITAIKASYPSPHRLLLTKMRAEIDQRGLAAEATILGNRHLQAEWLNDFLNPVPADTKAVLLNTVNRHWEALGDQLRLTLNGFAEQLHQFFSPLGTDNVMAGCGLNKADVGTEEALKYFNCFSSTKPIDRSHLTTGHVLRIGTSVAGEDSQFWICLSPACDMVPGQKTHSRMVDCLPFIAVKLHKVSAGCALKSATKNIFLFLAIDRKVETFSIHKEGNVTSNPDWELMFARNSGRFNVEYQLTLGTLSEIGHELVAGWGDASVVAQLRSEYALNLLQRIGALLSRPGLGLNFKGRQE